LIADYIDDLITMNACKEKCLNDIDKIIQMFDSLGFIIHPDKSNFEPSQEMEFLGFVINTVNMTVSLTKSKKTAIITLCQNVLVNKRITIRKLAKVIGKFNSCFISISYGKLHYRALERFKISALKKNFGKFDTLVNLPDQTLEEISWWINNIPNIAQLQLLGQIPMS